MDDDQLVLRALDRALRGAGFETRAHHDPIQALASLKPVEAMERLLKKLSEFDGNEEFLSSF